MIFSPDACERSCDIKSAHLSQACKFFEKMEKCEMFEGYDAKVFGNLSSDLKRSRKHPTRFAATKLGRGADFRS